jgi:hypothetical protein
MEELHQQIAELKNLLILQNERLENVEKLNTPILDFASCLLLLKCKTSTLRSWMADEVNPIPFHQPTGARGQIFFFRNEIDSWLVSKDIDKSLEIKREDYVDNHAHSKAMFQRKLGVVS